jgi:hypothetical protein
VITSQPDQPRGSTTLNAGDPCWFKATTGANGPSIKPGIVSKMGECLALDLD